MADGKMISASQLLTLFLFPPARQHGFISLLSGGEKKRLYLLNILMKNPNFLILDEPTNDLDIDTLNVLEEFLTTYTGILLMVSHDRYLLDKLTDQLFVVEGSGRVDLYNGNYSSYRLEQEEAKQALKQKPVAAAPAPVVAAPKKNKLSFKEQKELENTEVEINKIEGQIKALTEQLNTISDHQQIINISTDIEKLNAQLDEKSMRWMELTELKES
jgi:ATP-binding cassette subfamily F protein uup